MKCLENARTGAIVRISDIEANKIVGSQWKFIPKSKWKETTRKVVETPKEIEIEAQVVKKPKYQKPKRS
jgi:hypothetical protein